MDYYADLYLLGERDPELYSAATSTNVTIRGRHFKAPGDPESALEKWYGPNWRTPDPAKSKHGH